MNSDPPASSYPKRLGTISTDQFQAALDRFDLGEFLGATAIPFGLFGQNVFVSSTTGDYVLRGAAHYQWQFPAEQFMARQLHEQSDVAVPWPYLYDESETIFGWKHGYVVMPKMPGLQLADVKVVGSLSNEDRLAISYALGENLSTTHHVSWECAGNFDLSTSSIKAFPSGFAVWFLDQIHRLLRQSATNGGGFAADDRKWIYDMIDQTRPALEGTSTVSLVLHDYKEANVTVERSEGKWKVSGVFDLMEAFFGDGELDLARQFGDYCEAGRADLAKAFLSGYVNYSSMHTSTIEKLRLYLVYDRLLIWEYFHRPEHVSNWWHDLGSFRDWAEASLSELDSGL